MKIEAKNLDDYISKCPEDRIEAMQKLVDTVRDNIDSKFSEAMSYGMPGWVVPHSIYPDGYHCKPAEPLPFMSIASQKNFVAFYHMGIYANEELMKWFVDEYPKHCSKKLDMGKSCIRFKKVDDIPYELLGELVSKMSADDWISLYAEKIKK
ncbi:MAG: DUF1801 domain-containing protein [Crocinitomicaceae bacterium]